MRLRYPASKVSLSASLSCPKTHSPLDESSPSSRQTSAVHASARARQGIVGRRRHASLAGRSRAHASASAASRSNSSKSVSFCERPEASGRAVVSRGAPPLVDWPLEGWRLFLRRAGSGAKRLGRKPSKTAKSSGRWRGAELAHAG